VKRLDWIKENENGRGLKRMRLRHLEEKDTYLMLEWMHDPFVVEMLGTDFMAKTIEDCALFIHESHCDNSCLHMAVVDEEDTYMGTVSLKNIMEGTAEFAIVVRSAAMGRGYAAYAMNEIIKIGFEKIGLQKIYWYVARENQRAVRFYDKNKYNRMEFPLGKPEKIRMENWSERYLWYMIEKE